MISFTFRSVLRLVDFNVNAGPPVANLTLVLIVSLAAQGLCFLQVFLNKHLCLVAQAVVCFAAQTPPEEAPVS